MDKALMKRIDKMVAEIYAHKVEPGFSEEVRRRENFAGHRPRTNRAMLRYLCELIAYSQGAKDVLVKDDFGDLAEAMANYDPDAVVKLRAEDVLAEYWHRLGALRYKRKIVSMRGCALVINELKARRTPLPRLIKSSGLPEALLESEDIDRFWSAFSAVQSTLKQVGMPFFSSFTSLCHLLMAMGYPSSKPDLTVMRTSRALSIAPARKTYGDGWHYVTVRAMQQYSVARGIKMQVLDLYFMIRGGQSGVRHLVDGSYPPYVAEAAAGGRRGGRRAKVIPF